MNGPIQSCWNLNPILFTIHHSENKLANIPRFSDILTNGIFKEWKQRMTEHFSNLDAEVKIIDRALIELELFSQNMIDFDNQLYPSKYFSFSV